jgi:hypothetical protein
LLIVKDPSIVPDDQEPDDVKRRVEAALASAGRKNLASSGCSK